MASEKSIVYTHTCDMCQCHNSGPRPELPSQWREIISLQSGAEPHAAHAFCGRCHFRLRGLGFPAAAFVRRAADGG